tara:strand:- start:218 stop:421 length:204 start_codon:yes stop_codon:yes gene_type:complete
MSVFSPTLTTVGRTPPLHDTGIAIPVSWSGGVLPTVVNVGLKTDIYSFQTFDGGASLYGVVVGQNFS